ncbi:MAG: hypothetical protein ACQ9MH_16585 [Nitrospinales bacterium]
MKYYLLLYDKVFFLPIDVQLNPGHTKLSKRFSLNDAILSGSFQSRKDAHYALMYTSERDIWDDYMKRLMDLYDELEEKGILVALHDENFENPSSWHPLKSSVEADLKDKNFVSLCSRYINDKIYIPRADEAKMKGGGVATRPAYFKGDNGIFAICSERLNTTLLFAEKQSLFPISPYRMYVDFLSAKLRRISSIENRRTIHERDLPIQKHKLSMLSWEITTEVIPQDTILRKSSKDILRYKSACGELKNRFNSYLLSLESTLNCEPWDSNFEKELNKIINKELLPEIQRIRDSKIIIWEKLFGDTLKSLSSMKILPPLIGLHLVPGFSFIDILTMSTALVSSATLPKLIDAWKEERQLRRNALFFLVNFSKK